jgi:pimeloyl-ACP methyl ester carboxylesterase
MEVDSMPYADNQGIRIHYQVEGKGPPLVLQHGLCGSLEMWRQEDYDYVKALKNDHQIVLIDARGHGASDKPHDPQAYKMASMVADVIAVLDDLKISKAHFLGYSMGGRIGWGIAKYAPERFHSLIIGGSGPPYESDPEEPSFFRDLFKKEMDAVSATMETIFGSRWTPSIQAIIRSSDLDALIALTSAGDWISGLPGFEDVLSAVTVPCLLFVGEKDPSYPHAQKASEVLPNATFVSFPDLDHIEAVWRIDLVLPHIRKFLAEVS